MQKRVNYLKHADALAPLRALHAFVRQSGLEASLIELVFMRVSQLNGCAYCLDRHSKDARANGENEHRLYLLQAWREAPFYSQREQAALVWCEAVTLLDPVYGVSEEIYALTRERFSEVELIALNMATVLMNGWNRLAIAFKSVPGSYKPPATAD